MPSPLSVMQTLGLVLAGVVAGAALLILAISWLASTSGDGGAGCAGIGWALLVLAFFIIVMVF